MSGVESVDKALGQAVEDIGGYIRKQRESAQVSLRQLAKVAGISNPYLSQIERGLRKPSAEILGQIATGLRISAEALYVRAGLLEERQGSAVLDSLACDPELTERQLGTGYGFGLFADGNFCGEINLSSVQSGPFQSAYVGYWVDEKMVGNGYVPEALVVLARYVFEELHLHRIQIAIIPRNAPSRRVVEKLKIREEGIAIRYLEINGAWEDHVRYAITAEEWWERRDDLLITLLGRALALVPPADAEAMAEEVGQEYGRRLAGQMSTGEGQRSFRAALHAAGVAPTARAARCVSARRFRSSATTS